MSNPNTGLDPSRYPYKCGFCNSQFHFESGFNGHMGKHRMGMLDKKGHVTKTFIQGYWKKKYAHDLDKILIEIASNIIIHKDYEKLTKYGQGSRDGVNMAMKELEDFIKKLQEAV